MISRWEWGGSDRPEALINQGQLKGESSLPLVVPTINMVTERNDRGGGSLSTAGNQKFRFQRFYVYVNLRLQGTEVVL